MFKVFPELTRIFKDLSSKTALYLIENHTTPERLREVDPGELTRVLRRVSRARVKEEKTRSLLEAAKDSLGVREGLNSLLREIGYILSQIRRINDFIEGIEEDMEYWLSKIPYAKRLLLIKGIGLITVSGIIGEVADFSGFKSQSEILKLAGLDLYEISSGKHKGRHHISKRGRALPRILYFGALNTVRQGGNFVTITKGFLGEEKRSLRPSWP